ncbi:MAG: hypothetical protein HYW62_04190 [Candidatus Levybacteria bacterium]|nr:hypothetical protein [Candidatus Levybacteria bacterium]
MYPTQEEKQNYQDQKQESRQGIISRGINSVNNLRNANRLFSNPIGRIGSKVAVQTALRGFAVFLIGPGLPILIAIVLVSVLTFIIVGFGGAPALETGVQTLPNHLPTQKPTSPPAAP